MLEAIARGLQAIYDQAMLELGRIASDQRYNDDYRAEQFQAARTAALGNLDSLLAAELAGLEAQRAGLAEKTWAGFAPSAESVGQLNYLKDALRARWAVQEPHELLADWQTALDAGDLLSARVFADFAPAHLKKADRRGPISPTARDLLAATTDRLLPSEARSARQRMAELDETTEGARRTAARLKAMLEGAKVDRNGQIVDGVTDAARKLVRETR